MRKVRVGAAAVALLLVLGVAFSQDAKDDKKAGKEPPVKLRGFLPMHFGKLGLRDDQKQAIYRIQGEYKGKIEELNRKIAQLKAEQKDAMDKVLTAEQRTRLKELRSGEKIKDK
jgi:Spy/CpxP family protein refolding chaperone